MATDTNSSLPPALTPDEWKAPFVERPGPNEDEYCRIAGTPHEAMVEIGHRRMFGRADGVALPALLALANNALPDDSPYKLRSRHVAALTNVTQGVRDPEDMAVLDELGAILVALLPPPE